MAPRSRSKIFLRFAPPPKDHDADIRVPTSGCSKNGSRCRRKQRRSTCPKAFRGVVVRFRKPETHTNAPQRYNTPQTMAIEAREGQAAADRQMVQEAAASLRNTAVLWVPVRGQNCGLTLRQHLEKNYPVPTSALTPLCTVPNPKVVDLDRSKTHPAQDLCTLHVEPNCGADNFQDRKIHQKGVLCLDLKRR